MAEIIQIQMKVKIMADVSGLPLMSDLDVATVIFDGGLMNWDAPLFDIMIRQFEADPPLGVEFFQGFLPGLEPPELLHD